MLNLNNWPTSAKSQGVSGLFLTGFYTAHLHIVLVKVEQKLEELKWEKNFVFILKT